MPFEEPRHQHHGHPQGRFGLEVLHVAQEGMRQSGGGNGPSDELRARILVGIARWFRNPRGREGVHAVDQAGVFQGVPHAFVLRLNRVVAHGVHGPDQGNPATLGGHAINLFNSELGVLHGDQGGEVETLRVLPGVFVGPIVVGLAHGPRPQGVLQPGVGVDAGWYDHHLVDALHVHVPQAGAGLVGSGVGEVIRLLFGERSFRVEVADIEGALDVVFEPGTGQPHDVDGARPSLRNRGKTVHVGLSVDQQLVRFGVVPHSGFQRFQLAAGEAICGTFPDGSGLHDVRIAVEGGEIFGHWPESLHWHDGPSSWLHGGLDAANFGLNLTMGVTNVNNPTRCMSTNRSSGIKRLHQSCGQSSKSMKYRRFGPTGITVSVLEFCWRGRIFTHLISHRKEVKRRCRTVFRARATELSGPYRTEIHHPADVIPALASV